MHSLSILMSRIEELGLDFLASNLETFLSNESRQADRTLLDQISDLIELEYIPRKERMAKTRIKVSGIPKPHKRLEEFDLSWLKGGLPKKAFDEMSTLSFISRKENIIFLGPSGLGKTHLMRALGFKACMNDYTAYHISCVELIEKLKKAQMQNRLQAKLKWFQKPNVLLIDEVGYDHLDRDQAALIFQLVNARYENGSIIMTTNKPFSKWGEIMSDDAVATATLDRLLHHASIFALNGDSYRMKEKMKVGMINSTI